MGNLTNKRIQIREGWDEAGRQGTALGGPIFVGQDWIPVKWDDEEDPTFHKRAGLILAPDKPTDIWAEVRAHIDWIMKDNTMRVRDDALLGKLLSDAEALLKVKNVTQEYFHRALNGTISNAIKVKEALADLPENLK